LAAEVEAEVQSDFENEVASRHIGQMVMDRLGHVDQVAYVRFASVYREFKDVADFVAELRPILNTPARESEAEPD
jgi:transcriptional repressor NrdR